MALILDGSLGVPVTTVTGTLPVANGGTGVATSTGSGANALATSPTLTTPVLSGSVTGTYTLAGTPTITSPTITGASISTMASSVITSGTAVATTSGTSITFTGIPSWVKRITMMFNAVSTNGSSYYQIRLGTSGGVVATGYASASMYTSGGGLNAVNSTTGFQFHNISSGYNANGSMTITNLTSNTWTATGSVANTTGGDFTFFAAGGIALGGVLDRISLTTVNGTDTFDAGSINILYE